MRNYLNLVSDILENGDERMDRTGVGTISVFGRQLRFDLQQGFPLVTTKKVFLKGIIYELLWFTQGSTNIKYLVDHNVHIWDEWANEEGELGPVYGKQWRKWTGYNGETIDQLGNVIEQIKKNPHSRRLVVTAWNPADVAKMALPPCHMFYQFYVKRDALSCQMYMRSVDTFLGLPFNIASYALLTMMVAQVTDLKADELIITTGDTHIYSNHIEQVKTQILREPYPQPTMKINPDVNSIDEFKYEDFHLENYLAHPSIKADIAV